MLHLRASGGGGWPVRICDRGTDRVQCEQILRGQCVAKAKGRVTVNKTRGFLYLLAKLLGDFQAACKGRVGKRIARRAAGRATGKGLGRLFR